MKRSIGLIASLAILLGIAQASPVTYRMVFRDQTGEKVGEGHLSYDPAVKQDIYFYDTTVLCDPLVPDPGGLCQKIGALIPVSLTGILYMQDLTSSDNGTYLDGTVACAGSCFFNDFGSIAAWNVFNYTGGVAIGAAFIPGQRFAVWDFNQNDTGIVEYIPTEVPLPGGLWLFLAGLGGAAVSAQMRKPQR